MGNQIYASLNLIASTSTQKSLLEFLVENDLQFAESGKVTFEINGRKVEFDIEGVNDFNYTVVNKHGEESSVEDEIEDMGGEIPDEECKRLELIKVKA
jgi:hypothetical protein